MKMISCVIALIMIATTAAVDGRQCEDPEYRQRLVEMKMSNVEDESRLPPAYECPDKGSPSTFTECCETGGCCPKNLKPDEPNVLIYISIVVIGSCVITAAIIIVCCFCQECPLYESCRVDYNNEDIVMYTLAKEEDPSLALMPLENGSGIKYKTSNVKLKSMEDV